MKKSFEYSNDEDIIEAIEGKYLHHLKQAEKFKGMLDAYNAVDLNTKVNKVPVLSNGLDSSVDKTQKTIPREKANKSRETFESIILDIMNDGKPRLVSELINEYYERTGKKLSSKDLSSKLSIRSQKGNIKNAKFINYPIEKRFWWGKSSWFNEDGLKPEYINIVNEKYKSME